MQTPGDIVPGTEYFYLSGEDTFRCDIHWLQLGLQTEQVECLGVVVVKQKRYSRGESMYQDPKPKKTEAMDIVVKTSFGCNLLLLLDAVD